MSAVPDQPLAGGTAMDSLRAKLVGELRDRLIHHAVSLPLGNQAALTRVASQCEHGASPREIADVATADEGFATVLLRVANSAASASATRIEDLPTAIARLGLRLVQSLAVSAPCLRLLAAPADDLVEQRVAMHRHAVLSGVTARALAPSDLDGDRAIAAGLVHNVGLSIISLYAPSGFRKLLTFAQAGDQLADRERALFGFSHAELGAVLAEEWSYPPGLVEAVREHDSPRPQSDLAALVQVAERLVREQGVGVEAPDEVSADLCDRLGLDLERAREVVRDAVSGEGISPALALALQSIA
jgi:HD-like signal output (HDOD) protein